MTRPTRTSAPLVRHSVRTLAAGLLSAGIVAASTLPAAALDSPGQVDVFRPKSGSLLASSTAGFRVGDSLAAGDISSAGAEEIVLARATTGRISVRNASGAVLSSFSTAYDNSGDKLAVGDLTGDGADEIVIANNEGGRVDVHNLFGFKITSLVTGYDSNDQVAMGDITGDGIDELVVANTEGGGRMDVLNVSGFQIATLRNTGFDSSDSVAVGNLTGNGRNEIVVANDEQGGRVDVYGGTGGLLRRWSSGVASPQVVVGNVDFGSLEEIGLVRSRTSGTSTPSRQPIRFYTASGTNFRTVSTSYTPTHDARPFSDAVALANVSNGSLNEIVVANR